MLMYSLDYKLVADKLPKVLMRVQFVSGGVVACVVLRSLCLAIISVFVAGNMYFMATCW